MAECAPGGGAKWARGGGPLPSAKKGSEVCAHRAHQRGARHRPPAPFTVVFRFPQEEENLIQNHWVRFTILPTPGTNPPGVSAGILFVKASQLMGRVGAGRLNGNWRHEARLQHRAVRFHREHAELPRARVERYDPRRQAIRDAAEVAEIQHRRRHRDGAPGQARSDI